MGLPKPRMRHAKATPVREAVTLLEVVISIGVATIGLLAAVALLPVAARQIEIGLIADQAAAAGEAAQQTADIIGVRNPLQWRTFWFNGTNYATFTYGRNPRNSFDINLDMGFRQAAYDANVLPQLADPFDRIPRPIYSAPVTGFVIDPYWLSDPELGLAANARAVSDGVAGGSDVYEQFVASTYDLQLFPYFTTHPFDDGNAPANRMFNMRRLSLASVAGAFGPALSSMNAGHVEQLFTIPDDLRVKRPEGDLTLPAIQEMVTVDDTTLGFRFAMKRDTQRDLSWMVTFVPLLSNSNASTYSGTTTYDSLGNLRPMAINNDIGTNATYTMSIVVHRRRTPVRLNVIPGTPASFRGATAGFGRNGMPSQPGTDGQPGDEMVAQIAYDPTNSGRGFLSGGFGGGDVVMETPLNNQTPLNHIRTNDWVLLSGVDNMAATNFGLTGMSRDMSRGAAPPPVVRHQWYRVVNVGELVQGATIGGLADRHARAVTLEGPDWQVGNTPVQVTIVPSVVAVFEKTVTLAFPLN